MNEALIQNEVRENLHKTVNADEAFVQGFAHNKNLTERALPLLSEQTNLDIEQILKNASQFYDVQDESMELIDKKIDLVRSL